MRTYGKINATPQNEFLLDEQHVSDKQPLLPARRRESERGAPDHRGPVPFTSKHKKAVDEVCRAARDSEPKAAAPRTPAVPAPYLGSAQSRLLSRETLAAVSDLLDIRDEDLELRQRVNLHGYSRAFAVEAIRLMAALVADGQLDGRAVMNAIKQSPGDAGQPPFLLAVASAALHDRRVAATMCELLEAVAPHVNAGSPGQLAQELLELDSPHGARSREERPKDLTEKYTNFFGRLIGDGMGEFANDGAVLTIGRLDEAGLLPSKEQVTDHRSRCRWRKQKQFVDMCRTLRQLPPWRDDRALDRSSLKEITDRLHRLLGGLSVGDTSVWSSRCLAANGGKREGANDPVPGARERVEKAVEKCVAEVLQKRWKEAGDWAQYRMVTRVVDEVLLDLQESEPTQALRGMARLPPVPPTRVVDQVMERLIDDDAFRKRLFRATLNDVGDSFLFALEQDVQTAADEVLNGLLKRLVDIETLTSPAPRGESRGSMKRR